MTYRKAIAASVLGVMLLASVPAIAAPKTDKDVVREARDRDEIEHLAWRYARALDTFNPEAYAATYTPDGAFGQTKGHDALFKMIDAFNHPAPPPAGSTAPARTGPPGLLHMETNHWIEFKDKDHATFHCYWITIGKPAKQGDPTTVIAAGNGIDEVVRLNGQWLFKSRQVVAPDDK
jgi:hypothetical protein